MSDLISKMRQIRIFGLSSFDFGLTLFAFFIILFLTIYFKRPTFLQFLLISIVYFITLIFLGIIVHYLLGVNTKLNYLLGLSKCPPDYNSLTGIFDC